MTACGPQLLIDFLEISSLIHGQTLSEYSEALKLITQGVSLESANCYTYRTPHYQLSGAQDHMKGMNAMQEHIWQATIDSNAVVFTNSPGGITKDFNEMWVGGWKPRATLYKNVGVIQYDRETMPLEAEALIFFLNLFTGMKFYNHAYFPRWAFDEVREQGKWVFGAKGDAYVALYSHKAARWESNYELRVDGYKNCWLVELGSSDEFGSFENFTAEISQATIQISPEAIGYSVNYDSPSQGSIDVAWDGPMEVNGTDIDLGPYPRFDNKFCYQAVIQWDSHLLELDFGNGTRTYS
jgi:hypothetical protein